jgi:AraC-like DNA-binding protein
MRLTLVYSATGVLTIRVMAVLTIYVRPATTGEDVATAGSTQEISGFDEPGLWRANLGTAFSDLVPDPLDREIPPEGTLHGLALGGAAVFTVSGNPQAVRRTTIAARHSPVDMLKVCVQMRGRATVHQDDLEIVLDPGQFAVYDMARPYALRLEGTWTCAVMAVRRDLIEIPVSSLNSAMKRAHPSRQGPGLLLSQFITATVSQLDDVAAGAAGMLGEAGACLLAGSLTGDGDAAVQGGTQVLRDRVMAYIRARLDDPQLSRTTIAAAHRISPRTLDRLFAGQEWSVSGFIRHERLEAVRRDLENPALLHHSVAGLAARWCFFDAAHFSRIFREAYGYPPSQARPEAHSRVR